MIETNFYSFLGSTLLEKECERKKMADMCCWRDSNSSFKSIFFAIFHTDQSWQPNHNQLNHAFQWLQVMYVLQSKFS